MNTLAPSFLIGSSSYLQVTRTSITSRTSTKFGQIWPRTAELTARERLEKSPLIMEESCEHSSSFIFDWINLILAGVTRTCIKAWMSSNFGQIPPPTPELSALARLKNCWEHSSAYIFDWIFFIFSGNEDNQQVWTEFEFWPDGTKGCRVIALDRRQKLVFAQYLENGWTEFNQIL